MGHLGRKQYMTLIEGDPKECFVSSREKFRPWEFDPYRQRQAFHKLPLHIGYTHRQREWLCLSSKTGVLFYCRKKTCIREETLILKLFNPDLSSICSIPSVFLSQSYFVIAATSSPKETTWKQIQYFVQVFFVVLKIIQISGTHVAVQRNISRL